MRWRYENRRKDVLYYPCGEAWKHFNQLYLEHVRKPTMLDLPCVCVLMYIMIPYMFMTIISNLHKSKAKIHVYFMEWWCNNVWCLKRFFFLLRIALITFLFRRCCLGIVLLNSLHTQHVWKSEKLSYSKVEGK